MKRSPKFTSNLLEAMTRIGRFTREFARFTREFGHFTREFMRS